MARFEDLPADQKAVLQLVLRQGRTYEEIASLLKISPEAVRDRALTALDAIGPQDVTGVEEDRQDEIGDHLLGQQSAAARAATREHLEGSQPARDWARAVAGELRTAGVAGENALPEIPADPAAVDEDFDALAARRGARADQQRSSRLGGLLLIVAAVIIVAGGVLVLTNVLGGDDDDGSPNAAATTTTATSATDATTNVEQQINLTPPGGGNKPLGVANIVSQSGKRAIAVVGQDLPASGHYVLWLRNGAKVKFLGFFPVVTGKGTNKGRLQGLVGAPSDLKSYAEMLVTREPDSTPKAPTAIILRGSMTG
ncbi:MAG TPA: sigma factor-like helix-turn-helix DNA-binding protein [Baekduia sp.]|nr:sigma factor-like helix-turn-helix DNA-binding protein [Baekduia sp.]